MPETLSRPGSPHPAAVPTRPGPTSPHGGEVNNNGSPHPAGVASRPGPTSSHGGEVKNRVRVLSILAEDGPHTLTKLAGAIRRRGFHVRGISVGPGRQPGL